MITYLTFGRDLDSSVTTPEWRAQNKWSATWQGDLFFHVPGEGVAGIPHPDAVMNYITWDGRLWQANWDLGANQFSHMRAGSSHNDRVLNYLDWDGNKWSAIRDGDGFFHFFIADAEKAPGFLEQVAKFVGKNEDLIKWIIAAAD